MKPTRNNIIVKRIPGSTETSSGIILKTTLEQDRGEVQSVGPDVTEVEVGNVVFLNWNSATKVEDETYVVSIENVVFVY
jgi:co-chaperonin GroES (HSP10)